MSAQKPIVIIGGMGPQASVLLYRKLIEKASSEYGVTANEQYPHIVIQSLNVPDFISSQRREIEAITRMKQAVQTAGMLNPSVVAMACNTAHIFQEQILEGASIPFVSLIELVTQKANEAGYKTVGLVASPTTIATGLYEQSLNAKGMAMIAPTEERQAQLEQIIRSVIAGVAAEPETERLHEIMSSLTSAGAEAIILGCTELPIVFDPQMTVSIKSLDCLDVLASDLLERYYSQ